MLFFPNAKINLGLNVTERRSDGFHNIETLFVPVYHLCDVLEVLESESFEMQLMGTPFDGKPEDNICVKAYNLLAGRYKLPPVKIILFKNISVGAGLGGGSADGAFTLTALNTLFKLGLSPEELASFAAELGSDCPFFIYNRPMMAKGKGEILSPFEGLPEFKIKVVPQKIFVSTARAYAGIQPKTPGIHIEDIVKRPIEEWKGLLVNDFETTIFKLHPELAEAKQKLYDEGAVYASMTGSGSSLYAIYCPECVQEERLLI